LFLNIEFRERKKLILNQVKRTSHFVKIIVACPHRLPKLPESTKRKQAIPNMGSLFYSHCAGTLTAAVVVVVTTIQKLLQCNIQKSPTQL
jgi:hypothetical protein